MDKGTYNARKIYYKRWRAKNKDKIRAYNKQYWERRAKREEVAREEERKNAREYRVSDD